MNNTPNNKRPRGEAPRTAGYPRPRPSQPDRGRDPDRSSTGRQPRPRPDVSRPASGYRPQPAVHRPAGRRSGNGFMLWFLVIEVILLIALIVTFIIVKSGNKPNGGDPTVNPPATESSPSIPAGPATPETPSTGNTGNLPDWRTKPTDMKAFVPKDIENAYYAQNLNSEYAILVSLEDGKTIASKKSEQRMYPASMTKIMTVIVACEHISDMYETFAITEAIRYPLDNIGASLAWFEINQPITLLELIYGAWLPSGADATAALAVKIAGSEAEFVKLMNAKAAEIGCTGTNFVNASGLHDDNHYSTVKDMATIMAYAVNNPFIKQVMCARSYETQAKLQKTENVLYATWYTSMPADYGFFMGAKTGYEVPAGSCMASLIKGPDGKEYVVVTGKASYPGSENRFKDVKTLYDTYIK